MFHSAKKVAAGVTALAALGLGGSALASAATSSTPSTSQSTSSAQPPPGVPAHGTAAHENAEKAVTGQAAAKAQAAAVKSVGSGTAGRVTTDYRGSGFEVTVTKPDGSMVEVHLDRSYNVMQAPSGHPGAPPAYGP